MSVVENVVDFEQRCFAYLTDTSSIDTLIKAIKEAVALYWFKDNYTILFLNPCMTLKRDDFIVSCSFVGNTQCYIIDNLMYARVMTTLITRKEPPELFQCVLLYDNRRIDVRFEFGMLVGDGNNVVIPRCFADCKKADCKKT